MKTSKTAILHHSVTGHSVATATIKSWGYDWIIRWNGSIVRGRGNAHTYGQNQHWGICLLGNFQNERPSKKQMEALIAKLRQLKIKKVTGHRDWRNKPWGHNFTACPGKHLYSKLPYLRKKLNKDTMWKKKYKRMQKLKDKWRKKYENMIVLKNRWRKLYEKCAKKKGNNLIAKIKKLLGIK